MKTIICFPPQAGGNHVKNLLLLNETNFEFYENLYNGNDIKVHAHEGGNLTKAIYYANDIVHGHFGEIMSIREDVQLTENKRWILISPDTYECRSILYTRLGELKLDGYFDYEQVFLYEPHMYHTYFKSKMDDIMNISVYELFSNDIDDVLNRLNVAHKDKAKYLHKIWKAKVS